MLQTLNCKWTIGELVSCKAVVDHNGYSGVKINSQVVFSFMLRLWATIKIWNKHRITTGCCQIWQMRGIQGIPFRLLWCLVMSDNTLGCTGVHKTLLYSMCFSSGPCIEFLKPISYRADILHTCGLTGVEDKTKCRQNSYIITSLSSQTQQTVWKMYACLCIYVYRYKGRGVSGCWWINT